MAGTAPTLCFILLAVFFSATAEAQTAPAFSPKLSRLFAGAPPKFDPPKPDAPPSAPIATGDQPRNGIIHLPSYIVRGQRLEDEYLFLTEQGREAALARRYAGPQTRLDRTLNAVTLDDLWRSIPLLGRIPFISFGSLTYNQRATMEYEQVEQKRRFGELLEIEQFAQKAEKAKPAAPPAK
jgi:hypothetical protein